jgi:hypothetical protein
VTDVFGFFLASDSDITPSDSDVFSSVTECTFQEFFFLTGVNLQNRSFCVVRCFSSFSHYPRMIIIYFQDKKHLFHNMFFIYFTEVKKCAIFWGNNEYLFYSTPRHLNSNISSSANSLSAHVARVPVFALLTRINDGFLPVACLCCLCLLWLKWMNYISSSVHEWCLLKWWC